MRIYRPGHLAYQTLLGVIIGVGVAVVGQRLVPGGGWLGLVPLLVVGGQMLRGPLRRWRATREAFPAEWHAWLLDHVPFYERLDAEGRTHFQHDVAMYLAEQAFEAVEGVELDDELRLSVAAGAALMLHGRPDWDISTRRTVLFYPSRFDDDYFDTPYANYDGMVHGQGPVIFAADAVRSDWDHPGSGSNVVLHELAHLFDFDTAAADGSPSLMDASSAAAWRDLVEHEMRRIRQGRSLLRRYALTNTAEFFAVSVEVFFERPHDLYRSHRRLYDALSAFFNVDPRPKHVSEQ